jgi:hypothetical protein
MKRWLARYRNMRDEEVEKFVVSIHSSDSIMAPSAAPSQKEVAAGMCSIVEAHPYLESDQQIGKIVVTV